MHKIFVLKYTYIERHELHNYSNKIEYIQNNERLIYFYDLKLLVEFQIRHYLLYCSKKIVA